MVLFPAAWALIDLQPFETLYPSFILCLQGFCLHSDAQKTSQYQHRTYQQSRACAVYRDDSCWHTECLYWESAMRCSQ